MNSQSVPSRFAIIFGSIQTVMMTALAVWMWAGYVTERELIGSAAVSGLAVIILMSTADKMLARRVYRSTIAEVEDLIAREGHNVRIERVWWGDRP